MLRVSTLILACLVIVGCAALSPTQAPPSSTESVPGATPSTSPSAAPAGRKTGEIRFYSLSAPSMRDVPLLMALDELEAEGYTVQKARLNTAALLVNALTRGDADVTSMDNQTAWTAIAKGGNFRTIIERMRSSLIMVAGNDVKGCSDLNGKPVALSNTTGLNPALFNLYLQEKCPGVKVEVLVSPNTEGRVAALLSGQAVAAQLQREDLLQIEQKAPGQFHVLVALAEEFPNLEVYGVQARREWAQQHPEIVRDLIRAVLLAHRRLSSDPELLYSEGVKRLGIDYSLAKEIGDLYLSLNLWDSNGGLTPEKIQYTLDFLANNKLLPSELKPDDVADLSYLNGVLDELGRK
jgi:ABC-type nitrate/sulfonate/bicarbonate transport system substrate-binding protein